MSASRAVRLRLPPVALLVAIGQVPLAVAPRPAAAQYRILAPSGDSLLFTPDTLRRMLDSTRALYRDLEEDPRVGYVIGFGDPVSEEDPGPAYPWNAVDVSSDSTAWVTTPGNLREADRAYYNYAVRRMRAVRGGDPDVSCDSLLAVEERVVSAFAEGWIVARTLFGGPPFAPLDELAFARRAGQLRALVAVSGDRHVGACAPEWSAENPQAVATFEEWRRASFLGPPGEGDEAPPTPEGEPPGLPGSGSVVAPGGPVSDPG